MRVNKMQPDKKTDAPLGKLFYIIMRTLAGTEAMNAALFATFEGELRNFFTNQKNQEIRLYFGYSQNFGHRATTVNLMYRLLTYFPANIPRTIRIIYDIDSDNAEGPTPPEVKTAFCTVLSKLIPGLTYDTVFNAQPFLLTQSGYPSVTLQFNAYNPGDDDQPFDPPLTTACYFAITGGFDDSKNDTGPLQVKCLLSLQPYQFVKSNALNTLYFPSSDAEGILLGPRYNEAGTKPIEGKKGIFGLTYTKRAYYTPDPNITQTLWDLFQTAEPQKYAVVQKLIQLQSQNQCQLMPLYYSQGRIWGSTADVLFNMTEGLFRMKVLHNLTPNKCSVVIVFGGISNLEYNSFTRFVNMQDNLEDYPRLSAYLQQQVVRNRYTNRMRILPPTAAPDVIEAAVTTVGPEGVVFVNLGSVPQYIFNLLFFGADLPAVFEGEGSASMILNAGIPFLHLVSTDVQFVDNADAERKINQLYPTIPLYAANNAVALQCHLDSLNMLAEPQEWEEALDKDRETPGDVIGQFIYDSYTEGTQKYTYFLSMRPFFHDPKNDKLMMALMYTLGRIFGLQE